MRFRGPLPQMVAVAMALSLLGALGAFWPQWVGAAPVAAPEAPAATIGDAITYQGFLTDDSGKPLSGAFSMRFEIYNAVAQGDLLWESGTIEVTVLDGLFAARLEIEIDIFNGEELWLSQIVEGERLTPRQEILPAPMAHTLRPGAIIKGTASAIPNNYLLDVQMNNDVFAFNRGAISGQTTTGNAIYGLAESGRAIYGQTQDGYAVYGFDGGSNANRGYAGYFYSTNGVGVYGYSGADRSHPNILAPGIYGQSNRGVGVYGRGDTSNSFNFFNEGGYFEGGKGLYARGTDSAGDRGYGARIFSNNYIGLYVQGNGQNFDAYFGGVGGISTGSIVDRSASSRALAVNLGSTTIEPGDLVAMAGVASSPEGGLPMLGVAKVDGTNRNGVIGVAIETVVMQTSTQEETGEQIDFSPGEGAAAPGDYLVIITDGLAPAVKVSNLPSAEHWQIGDKVVLAASGKMTRAGGEADVTAIGRVAGPMNEATGIVPLFLSID